MFSKLDFRLSRVPYPPPPANAIKMENAAESVFSLHNCIGGGYSGTEENGTPPS